MKIWKAQSSLSRNPQSSRKGVRRHVVRSVLLRVRGTEGSQRMLPRLGDGSTATKQRPQGKAFGPSDMQGWGGGAARSVGAFQGEKKVNRKQRKELYSCCQTEKWQVPPPSSSQLGFHFQHCWANAVCLITRQIIFKRC